VKGSQHITEIQQTGINQEADAILYKSIQKHETKT
jgi:hypothetical protein